MEMRTVARDEQGERQDLSRDVLGFRCKCGTVARDEQGEKPDFSQGISYLCFLHRSCFLPLFWRRKETMTSFGAMIGVAAWKITLFIGE